MATVRVFEELQIWQMARVQCDAIFKLIEAGRFKSDFALSDQINRASGSVMDNIAEGFDRFSRADFRHFLIMARGSNAEVRSQYHRAKDRKHISDDEAAVLIEEARHLGIKINKLIQHLNKSGYATKPDSADQQLQEPNPENFAADVDYYDLPLNSLNSV